MFDLYWIITRVEVFYDIKFKCFNETFIIYKNLNVATKALIALNSLTSKIYSHKFRF